MRKLPVMYVGFFASTPGMNHTQHSTKQWLIHFLLCHQSTGLDLSEGGGGHVRKLPVTLMRVFASGLQFSLLPITG